MLDYYSKGAGPVEITIADKSGKSDSSSKCPAEAGVINRTTWDMRYDSPSALPKQEEGPRGGRSWRRPLEEVAAVVVAEAPAPTAPRFTEVSANPSGEPDHGKFGAGKVADGGGGRGPPSADRPRWR